MGIALAFEISMYWLTTMPSGKLRYSTCYIKHVVLGGNLLMHPRIVIAEFLGIQIGCCLLPTVTWPISPSFLMKGGMKLFEPSDPIFF